MATIEYCEDCGQIQRVDEDGLKATALMDTPDVENVRETLDELDVTKVADADLALISLVAYNGEFSDREISSNTASCMARNDDGEPMECQNPFCDHPYTTVCVLRVELVDEEDRLLELSCDECGFDPADASDWTFDIVESERWTEHHFICPACTYDGGPNEGEAPIVWAEQFDVQDDDLDTPAEEYQEFVEANDTEEV